MPSSRTLRARKSARLGMLAWANAFSIASACLAWSWAITLSD